MKQINIFKTIHIEYFPDYIADFYSHAKVLRDFNYTLQVVTNEYMIL